jgi:Cu(I)/Ag(I) efflux system periplasmic protein CusF
MLPAPRRLTSLLLLSLPLSLGPALAASACSRNAPAAPQAEVHNATGVIRSFGEGRKSARIAHDDIPDYMKAMTMTFDARSPEQLKDLEKGDEVAFSFTEESDGRYLIQSIRKR